MNVWIRGFAGAVLATVGAIGLSGCSKPAATPAATKDDHGKPSAKEEDHKDHGSKELKLPTTFKEGVAQLETLHKKIHHQIGDNELKHVGDTAKDIQTVAIKMKELAQRDVADDQRVEAGKLCNEIAGYFTPIDKAADDDKKEETEAVYKQLGATIEKMKKLGQ